MKKRLWILIGMILIISIGAFYFNNKKDTNTSVHIPNSASSTGDLTYINDEYKFDFKYPSKIGSFTALKLDECATVAAWDDSVIKSKQLAIASNVTVTLVCENLLDTLIKQFDRETDERTNEVVVNGKNGYNHYFVTSTGYEWRIFQIPLDANHYLEISYTYRYLPDYVELSEGEWNEIINSIEFK
ncbi:MAG: hypothetical protein JWN37_887 [Candidatus Nomurabacteria bacterium]|nr:hypothetical protein [Candidatus Nomurabacteria bacterium]